MEERGKFIAPARNPHGHAIGLCHEMLLPSPEPDQSEYRQALGLALKRDRFQGVEFRSKGDPVLYVKNPDGVTTDRQRDIAFTGIAQPFNMADAVEEISVQTGNFGVFFAGSARTE